MPPASRRELIRSAIYQLLPSEPLPTWSDDFLLDEDDHVVAWLRQDPRRALFVHEAGPEAPSNISGYFEIFGESTMDADEQIDMLVVSLRDALAEAPIAAELYRSWLVDGGSRAQLQRRLDELERGQPGGGASRSRRKPITR